MKVKISQKVYENLTVKGVLAANERSPLDRRTIEQKKKVLNRLVDEQFSSIYNQDIPFYAELPRGNRRNYPPLKFKLIDVDVKLDIYNTSSDYSRNYAPNREREDFVNEIVFSFKFIAQFESGENSWELPLLVRYYPVKDAVKLEIYSQELKNESVFLSRYASNTLLKLFNKAKALQISTFPTNGTEVTSTTKIKPRQYWMELTDSEVEKAQAEN